MRKLILKKGPALLLAFIMCLGLLPASAYAKEADWHVSASYGDIPYSTGENEDEFNKTIQVSLYNTLTKEVILDAARIAEFDETGNGVMRFSNAETGDLGEITFDTDKSDYTIRSVNVYLITESRTLQKLRISGKEVAALYKKGKPEASVDGSEPVSVQFEGDENTVQHYLVLGVLESRKIMVSYDQNTEEAVTGMPDPLSTLTDIIYAKKGKVKPNRLKISASVPEREGYVFEGWEYNKHVYDPGDSFTVPKTDVTFKARWIEESRIVWYSVFPGCEKMGTVSRASDIIDPEMKGASAESKDGFHFIRWVADTSAPDVSIGFDAKDILPSEEQAYQYRKFYAYFEADPVISTTAVYGSDSTTETHSVAYNGSFEFTARPDKHYFFKNVVIDGGDPITSDVEVPGENGYTLSISENGTVHVLFSQVTVDHSVSFYYEIESFTVTWLSQDGESTLETDNEVPYGTVPSFDGEEPEKAADEKYTYTFAGWAESADQESGKAAGKLPKVEADKSYFAAFSKAEIPESETITLIVNGSGSTTETHSVDHSGSFDFTVTPDEHYVFKDAVIDGGDPVTSDTEVPGENGYSLSISESGSVHGVFSRVTSDHTVSINYAIESFTVTWMSQDGKTTLETDESVPYGTIPVYDGKEPAKEADEKYTYSFAGWAGSEDQEKGTGAGSLPKVEADKTYYAAFSKTEKAVPGTITVDIYGNTGEKTYNGKDQKVEGFTVRVSGAPDKTAEQELIRQVELKNGCSASTGSNKSVGTYTLHLSPDYFKTVTYGNYTIKIVTHDGYMIIGPASVKVTANSLTKNAGEADPKLTVKVTGLIGSDKASKIKYTISRTPGEQPGTYKITVSGEKIQGQYQVTFVSGNLTIKANNYYVVPQNTPTPQNTPKPQDTQAPQDEAKAQSDPDAIDAPDTEPSPEPTPSPGPVIIEVTEPEEAPVKEKEPQRVWALLNLILGAATAVTGALLWIGTSLKQNRTEVAAEAKADKEHKKNKLFRLLGIIPALAAIFTFMLTENMTDKMVFADKWSILMAVYLIIGGALAIFMRSNKNKEDKEDKQP